jgi:hypothetical protein
MGMKAWDLEIFQNLVLKSRKKIAAENKNNFLGT